MAIVVAVAAAAVALRDDSSPPPTLPGWPAAGPRAADEGLRRTAWRAWSVLDASVRLEQTAMLFGADWREAEQSVVLLAMPYPQHVALAVVLVDGDSARRYSVTKMPREARFVTELVEAEGHSAALVVSPLMQSVRVSAATPGATATEDSETAGNGGALVPVAAGWTATRVVLKAQDGTVIADRVPGADSAPPTPPAPLILRETIDGDRRVQFRSDGKKVRCRVALADPEAGAPTLVDCNTA